MSTSFANKGQQRSLLFYRQFCLIISVHLELFLSTFLMFLTVFLAYWEDSNILDFVCCLVYFLRRLLKFSVIICQILM